MASAARLRSRTRWTHRRTISLSTALLGTAVFAACASASQGGPARIGQPVLEEQSSGTTQLLQAVSVVTSDVVWVSGHGGSYGRTTDGGRRWAVTVMRGADSLQFRDVHAASANTAWLLSAGTGAASRIYHTRDAGTSWALQWTNEEPEGFYDCLDFWDERRGFVYGDAVGGGLRVLLTDDGGATWRRVPDSALPGALPSEGGFAASGTCAVTGSDGRAWIAAGNAARARVFRTADYGRSWEAADAPVASGESAGLTSISMSDGTQGLAFGGHLGESANNEPKVTRTDDGGRSWTAVSASPFPGAIYGGAHVPGTEGRVVVTVGPGGAAVSTDGGVSWTAVDSRAWWGVGAGALDAVWITGPQGRIARLGFR